jgi:hypothetical protein
LKRRDAKEMIEQIPNSAKASPEIMGGGRLPQPSPALDEARLRQQAIGVKLRQMFDEIVNEPVPDEFLDILRRADQRPDAETPDADS